MAGSASDWLRQFRLNLCNRERNLTKLDRKEECNSLYKVCIFQADHLSAFDSFQIEVLGCTIVTLWVSCFFLSILITTKLGIIWRKKNSVVMAYPYTAVVFVLGNITKGATVTGCAPVVSFCCKGLNSMISKVKMQDKIQRDWNSMTLTFALTFCMWTWTRTLTPTLTRTPGV